MDKAFISDPMDSSLMNDDITEILPNLFLGSEAGARNLELLRRRGITHILTVMADPVPQSDQTSDNFRRMQISVQDWPDQDLMSHFKDSNAFIDAARFTAQEGVLVHCAQGVSRSATIVTAYLMASHPPLYDDVAALAYLRARRPIVQPNSGFLSQLALYGRCSCDLDANASAVEAWRVEQMRAWEGRVDRMNRERAEAEGVGRKRWWQAEWVTRVLP
ncbi:Dual specificity protein phosphatase 12-like isoform X1 [Mycena venus]|uniref:protein-tyrosine-phosphatase n=1 Tax=Mycena venus TaxID=2733690 RepID=A0A8H6YPX4_9AGAR|nr:Dual specificity protein phosphatase 12-like isoform X1 [Mycena venus]